jgi:hypothetical protein
MPVSRNAQADVVARSIARYLTGSAVRAASRGRAALRNRAALRGHVATARACEPVIEHLEQRQLMAADLGAAAAGTTAGSVQYAALAVSPSVRSTNPANGATNVRLDAFVAANDLSLPNGGVNTNTVRGTNNVTLRRVRDNALIAGESGVSGGGDSIIFNPSAYLQPNTQYRFEVNANVRDVGGNAFAPYAATFTTGTQGGPVPTAGQLHQGPAGQRGGRAVHGRRGRAGRQAVRGHVRRADLPVQRRDRRHAERRQVIDTVNNRSTTGTRTITGIVFAPTSTAGNLIAWVTHTHKADTNGPNFTSKISRLAGANLEQYQDYVVGLPRSSRDHLTNQASYRPGEPNALYVSQGSMNAMGAPDGSWGLNAHETLLSAAILKLNIPAVAQRISAGQGPLDVRTSGVANPYNPYAAGAPLTLYATGVRNGYDLTWHSNGKLFTAVNGSAAGGNTPASSNTGRRPPTGSAYSGQAVPGLPNVQQKEHDWLFNVEQNRYYGHPNPARGEFVFNGGNPTAGVDPGQIDRYPVGVRPDANWRPAVYDFGESYSPNGIIEYKSNTFGGALKNKLLVVRYAGGDDIIALTPRADGSIDAGRTVNSVGGKSPFVDPVDLIRVRQPVEPDRPAERDDLRGRVRRPAADADAAERAREPAARARRRSGTPPAGRWPSSR